MVKSSKTTPSKQHQDYDKIFKENLTKTGAGLLTKVCGLSHLVLENADTTLPRTIERRVDFLKIGTNPQTGTRQLYHLEFQSNVHTFMVERELLYYALLHEKHHLPIIQYVIYLGEGEWTAETQIVHPKLSFSYEVICLHKIDYELFVRSDIPEEIILAILGDFKGESKTKVAQKIIASLFDKTSNKRKLDKYIMQLEILSNLRKLQHIITKQLSAMSIHYDVTTDLRYLQGEEKGIEKGIEQGIEKGIEKGIEQGIEQGIEKAKKEVIVRLLKSKLLSVVDIATTVGSSVEEVEVIQVTLEN
jgi:predicted transposase YdaD